MRAGTRSRALRRRCHRQQRQCCLIDDPRPHPRRGRRCLPSFLSKKGLPPHHCRQPPQAQALVRLMLRRQPVCLFPYSRKRRPAIHLSPSRLPDPRPTELLSPIYRLHVFRHPKSFRQTICRPASRSAKSRLPSRCCPRQSQPLAPLLMRPHPVPLCTRRHNHLPSTLLSPSLRLPDLRSLGGPSRMNEVPTAFCPTSCCQRICHPKPPIWAARRL